MELEDITSFYLEIMEEYHRISTRELIIKEQSRVSSLVRARSAPGVLVHQLKF